MQLDSPGLSFPMGFCCNCGDTNCMNEIQDTRVTRYFGLGGTETTFKLPVPVCADCRRSTRRRPQGFFSKVLMVALGTAVAFFALVLLGSTVELPLWIGDHLFVISFVLALALMIVIWRLRRPKPPQTSFYQPVRIKEANVQLTDLMSGAGHVAFMKLAFTNPDYLNIFVNANRDAINAGQIAVVKA
ncbi:MAG TPA: hypothetical protein VGO61_15950 [Steroidobacteraceae bacterium]|jgi:hypothetical protein|nr:hypothetical protein [Steroidobacteraceae bacterium]